MTNALMTWMRQSIENAVARSYGLPEMGRVDDLEALAVDSTGTKLRVESNWKDSILLTGKRASAASRKMGNYLSEIPEKIKDECKECTSLLAAGPLLSYGAMREDPTTAAIVLGAAGLVLTVYSIYELITDPL